MVLMTNHRRRAQKKRHFVQGMTLLEMLLVLGLLVLLFGLLWGILNFFSRQYLTSERKVSRAQLVRAISQMLDDDLASAIQDPIHPLAVENQNAETQYVRRFGLRGDSRSLQIDVVQPNLFVSAATPEENRTAQVFSGKTRLAQVPELKTVFYEFVPIYARESSEETTSSFASNEELDGGSRFVGSLETPPFHDAEKDRNGMPGMEKIGIGAENLRQNGRPLVRKFGLSRYELDFETPDNASELNDELQMAAKLEGSAFVGSLATPASRNETGNFADDPFSPGNNAFGGGTENDERTKDLPMLTAAQIAMEMDDKTMWVPEVIDCTFHYFDGEQWTDHWDSIERNGLPTAIQVSLTLLPLDDVEVLRASSLLTLVNDAPPAASSSSEISFDLGSQWVGSLATPGEFSPNVTDMSPMTSPASNGGSAGSSASSGSGRVIYEFGNSSGDLSGSMSLTERNSPQTFSTDMNSQENFNGASNARLTGDQQSVNPYANDSELVMENPLSNGEGTSQDRTLPTSGLNSSNTAFAPQSSFEMTEWTLDRVIQELELTEPIKQQVVTFLPTTPLAGHQQLQRRQMMNVTSSDQQLSTQEGIYGTQTKGRRERRPRERTAASRTAGERSLADRTFTERSNDESLRGSRERTVQEREANSGRFSSEQDVAADRGRAERSLTERSGKNRSIRERIFAAVDEASAPSPDELQNVPEASLAEETLPAPPTEQMPPETAFSNNSESVPLLVPENELNLGQALLPSETSSRVVSPESREAAASVQTSRSAETTAKKGTVQTWIRGKR